MLKLNLSTGSKNSFSSKLVSLLFSPASNSQPAKYHWFYVGGHQWIFGNLEKLAICCILIKLVFLAWWDLFSKDFQHKNSFEVFIYMLHYGPHSKANEFYAWLYAKKTFLGVNGFDRSLGNTLWSFSWPAFSIFIWYLIQFLVNYLNVPFHVQTATYFDLSNTMHARGFSNRKLGFEKMFEQSFVDMLWKWKICCMSNSTLLVTFSRRPNYYSLPNWNYEFAWKLL